jgi:hypothetical protein
MTGTACKLRMMPDQWEGSIIVIKIDVRPSAGIMTGTTVRAKLTIVNIHDSMTGETVCRGSLICAVHMTGSTLNISVSPGQRERCIIVVEGHIRPSCWLMTCPTACTKLAVMSIPGRMTGEAILRRAFINSILMA